MKLVLKVDYDDKKYEVYEDSTPKYNPYCPYLIFYVKGGNRYLQTKYTDFMSVLHWIKEQYMAYDVPFKEVLEK